MPSTASIRDDSGFISFENLRDLLGRQFSPQLVQQMIADADFKANGVIDYEEFKQMMLGVVLPAAWPTRRRAAAPKTRLWHCDGHVNVYWHRRDRLVLCQHDIPRAFKTRQASYINAQTPSSRGVLGTPDARRRRSAHHPPEALNPRVALRRRRRLEHPLLAVLGARRAHSEGVGRRGSGREVVAVAERAVI